MTLHLETWHIVLILLVVVTDAVISVMTWSRLRRAERRLAVVRQLAEDHERYVPDDLINRTPQPVFERASRYWSRMVLRTLDEDDRRTIVRRR